MGSGTSVGNQFWCGILSDLNPLPEQKLERLGKPLRPRPLVVPRSTLNPQPQSLLTENRPPHDRRQFPHIVNHSPTPLCASCLGSSHRQKYSFRPNSHRPALFDRPPARRPKRRT